MCRLKINYAWSAPSSCIQFLGSILMVAKQLALLAGKEPFYSVTSPMVIEKRLNSGLGKVVTQDQNR